MAQFSLSPVDCGRDGGTGLIGKEQPLAGPAQAGAARKRRARREVVVEALDIRRIKRAKRSFTTRRAVFDGTETLLSGPVRPRTGDLVLARVDRLGQHGKLESPHGRRALLHIGDEILVTYADRYAPDQFEAQVPASLAPTQLVAAGGIASQMLSRNSDVRRATDITPIGLIGDAHGVPINIADFALAACPPPEQRPPTVAVLGTSMNSGKTTTAHQLVHALAGSGRRVGATKVTGTGAGGDYWVMMDAGAHRMLDFTDVGLASTYRIDMAVVERKAVELIDHLCASECEAIVVEVADGLFQRETAHLLHSELFRSRIDGVIFAAADALGAIGGFERLRALELNVLGIAGRLTRSPLALREAARGCSAPIFTLEELEDPVTALPLFGLEAPGDGAAEESSDVPAAPPEFTPAPADVDEPVAGHGSLVPRFQPVRWRPVEEPAPTHSGSG